MTEDPNIGRFLEDKYEIVGLLGQGGMGAVYEAVHRLINRRVAIKLLRPEYATDETVVQRFQREARASAAIGHDHIVGITDMGIADGTELFIVMEYLEGSDLGYILEDDGAISEQRACHIMIQVLSALEAAHQKGIVHRDLKPANIFVTDKTQVNDYVKLVDFGISKVKASDDGLAKGLTRTGELLGTPFYMAPEQARGDREITPATDLYACGVILYQMLTGQLPHTGDSYTALLLKVLTEDPPRPISLRPDLDPVLDEAVIKALAKDPRDRFDSGGSFRRVLTPFSPDTPIATGLDTTRISVEGKRRRTKTPGSASRPRWTSQPETPIATELGGTGVRRGLRPAVLVAGGIGALAVVLIAIILVLLAQDRPRDPHKVVWAAPPDGEAAPQADLAPLPLPPPPSERTETKEAKEAKQGAEPAGAASTLKLKLRTEPGQAEVLLDGLRIGSGNFIVRLPMDQRIHELIVRASGYEEHRETIRLDSDLTATVRLTKTRPAATKPAAVKAKGAGTKGADATPTPEPQPEPEKEPPAADPGTRMIDENDPW